MPEGGGLGLRKVQIVQAGGAQFGSFQIVADQPTNSLPIFTGEKSRVCSSETFIDGNGDTQVGTKTCGVAADLTNLSAGNIKSGVTIAGVSGTYIGVAPDPWDVRVGTTVNGVTGKLKVHCRNRVNSAIFNYDGPIGSIGQVGVTDGTAFDIWDTIDDYNGGAGTGLPGDIVTAWGSNTDCGGLGTAADDNVWTDVTTAGTGDASCAGSPERCTMQDKITGLWWSKQQSSSAWDVALSTCDSLDFNGYTDWRLPTHKELMEGYSHGIRSAASANWVPDSWDYFWSSSSVSLNTVYAWPQSLMYGTSGNYTKDNSFNVVCVRP